MAKAKKAGKKKKKASKKPSPEVLALAVRQPLTPALAQRIVVETTPQHPSGPVDPDTQLLNLGIVTKEAADLHRAAIQGRLNAIGWHIKQADIDSGATKTVADCRDSVLAHAF